MRNSVQYLVVALLFSISVVSLAAQSAPNSGLSPDARAALEQVVTAAKARDLRTLRAMMADGFKHSFGVGGDDPDIAIQQWEDEPEILDEMIRVIGLGCFQSGDSINCPGEGDTSYRAALERDSGGAWKLQWFIAGD